MGRERRRGPAPADGGGRQRGGAGTRGRAALVWALLALAVAAVVAVVAPALAGLAPGAASHAAAPPARTLPVPAGALYTSPTAAAPPASSPAAPSPAFPDLPVTAGAAILVEWRSGAVLWAHHPDERRQPASLTKMVTALVAMERGRLDDHIRVSALAASTPGSYMDIKEGEVYTLKDLLYGLLLESGNDAAVAIAQGVAGSQAAFCALMNRKAWELGAQSSHFVNAHGISVPGHYSTARDMATIARALLRQPFLAQVVATRQYRVRELTTGRELALSSTNQLLWQSQLVTGVKTGTTPAAGKCLVASARSGGLALVSVVLRSQERWADSLSLLGYGFRSFCLHRMAVGGRAALMVEVANGLEPWLTAVPAGDIYYPIHRDHWGPIQLVVDVWQPLKAPIHRGDPVGRLLVMEGGRPVVSTELLAGEDVPRLTPLRLWRRAWRRVLGLEGR